MIDKGMEPKIPNFFGGRESVQVHRFQLSHEKKLLWLSIILSLVVSTHLKNISQIGSFSPGRDENKKYLKPPPSTGWLIGILILAYEIIPI